MSVKIQTRSINPTVFNDLLTAGTDPLIARLCAARDVQSPAELDDKLAALLPYQTLTNCEAAAGRLADAVERKGLFKDDLRRNLIDDAAVFMFRDARGT